MIKNVLSLTRNEKKKHDKALVLSKSKLNSIETLVSQALIDTEISNKEFIAISNEKVKYVKMKGYIRTMKSGDECKKLKQQNYN